MVVDLTVQRDEPLPPGPSPEPNPQPDDHAASFTGHAYTADGHVMAGITIEFKLYPDCPGICHELQVATDDSGAYAIDLPDGVYLALCYDWTFELECGAAGSGGGGSSEVVTGIHCRRARSSSSTRTGLET